MTIKSVVHLNFRGNARAALEVLVRSSAANGS